MSGHTPGPWRAVKGAVVAQARTGHDDAENIRHYGGNLVCESVVYPANARLIAAAPQLLEGVKRWASECASCSGTGLMVDFDGRGHNQVPCEECDDIRALIALAGEEPAAAEAVPDSDVYEVAP